MDERRNRFDKIAIGAIMIYALGLLMGILIVMSLTDRDRLDLQPHVAEFFCTQEHVGKVYAVYSNHPFVDVKEYDAK